MDPIATLTMANGKRIVFRLLPEAAPNTVNSFIYLAGLKVFDHYPIQRFVPGDWVDMSYTAFGQPEAKYLIDNEAAAQSHIFPHLGSVGMGGYGELGIAGGEFYFPLRDCPELYGHYPMFGEVAEGLDEIIRLGQVPLVKGEYPGHPEAKLYHAVTPEIIETVRVETFGVVYPPPRKRAEQIWPENWK